MKDRLLMIHFYLGIKLPSGMTEGNMTQIALGKTGLNVEKNGFGALPIQRISNQEAVYLLQKAYDGGMNYFDSARGYTDSEVKLGNAFHNMWDKVIIATKTHAKTTIEFWEDLHASLRNLKTDCIDIYQFHNPPFCPKPGEENGLYDAMLDAKKQGKIRFIGITNHRLHVATEAVNSGLYETLQFPFSYLSDEKDLELVQLSEKTKTGFIAMKALSGGLLTDGGTASAWINQFSQVIPIWGIQREKELDEFLSYISAPPTLTDEREKRIDIDRKELQGNFCRACGYCLPCPQGIQIPTCARATLLYRRAPTKMLLSENGRSMMQKIVECIECGHCITKCPYGLNTPELLKKNYNDYQEILKHDG